MALIGTMKYLTIGDKTYEIAGDELQIASASTLGGIKVGSGLSIDSTTGVLSTSITETDPVFTASAAAGITATDISNWNSKTSNTGTITSVKTTAGTHTTINVSSGAANFNVPTATSHLTNDSGFITSFTDENVKSTAVTAATTYYLTGSTSSSTATGGLSKHAAIKAYVTANTSTGGLARIDLGNTTATTSAGGKEGIIRLYGTSATYYVDIKAGAPSANRTITLPNKTGTVALTSDIPTIPTKTSDLTNDSGFLTSYTETDPVFSTSAAAGITSTDISNWNAKVSDDKTWKGVSLTTTQTNTVTLYYIPAKDSTTLSGDAVWFKATSTPTNHAIAKWDGNSYLYSTTPSANDNSTKVATTAYVDAAIPNTSGFVNKSGDTMTDNLSFADGKGITLSYSGQTDTLKLVGYGSNFRVASFSTQTILRNIYTPDSDTAAANKKYVDDSIGAISIPTKTSDLTNDSGYITVSGITVSSSGSGNVVTGISKTNGVITYTLGTVTTVAAQIVRW